MEQHSKEAFVGLDVAKSRHAVAVADSGRDGEIRYLGEIASTSEAVRKLVAKLGAKYDKLHFCYEAGPTGYGLHRQLLGLGQSCTVVAPSLIPRKPGDRVKTNRRDALSLARLLRAGELTSVWVPDEAHEAVRDLVRARAAAVRDLRAKRQQVSSMLLRHGRSYSSQASWRGRHKRWLAEQTLPHRASQIALGELIDAVRVAEERRRRLEQHLEQMAEEWSLGPLVEALQAMRGMQFISALTFVAEVGDMARFDNPRRLMAYLGLVPSERSTGDSVKRGSITRCGNRTARTALVEGAWSYRFAPRISKEKLATIEDLPKAVTEIGWKAQARLCKRYRALSKAGKRSVVVTTAVAREMAAFIWAIAKAVRQPA